MSRTERGLLRMEQSRRGLNVSLYTCDGEPILSVTLLLEEVVAVADGRAVSASLHAGRWFCGPREIEVRAVGEWIQVRGGVDGCGRSALLRLRLEAPFGRSRPSVPGLLVRGVASIHVRLHLDFEEAKEAA